MAEDATLSCRGRCSLAAVVLMYTLMLGPTDIPMAVIACVSPVPPTLPRSYLH
jgi:hypothetical protein